MPLATLSLPAILHAQTHFALTILTEATQLSQQSPHGRDLWQHRVAHGRVTEVDYAVQALVGRRLEATFPGAALLAEEASQALRDDAEGLHRVTARVQRVAPRGVSAQVLDWIARGEGNVANRFWSLDPIDSTSGLIHGGAYSINLALIENGQVQLGAMAFPVFDYEHTLFRSGALFLAVSGHGAWRTALGSDEFQPIQVSTRRHLADAVRLRSLTKRHTDQNDSDQALRDRVTAELGTPHAIRTRAPVRYPLVACGEGDVLLRMVLSGIANQEMMNWDHAAGALLIKEAGGRVTDLDGEPLDFSAGRTLSRNRGLVASNGHLHEASLAALRRAGV